VQLPLYGAGGTAILLQGSVGMMGWWWCAWAVIDLAMLLAMLRRIAPQQSAIVALRERSVWFWLAAIALSHAVAPPAAGAIGIVLSALAAALFVRQLALVWTSRTLFDTSTR
jgi:hypothetical protein